MKRKTTKYFLLIHVAPPISNFYFGFRMLATSRKYHYHARNLGFCQLKDL